MRMEPAVCRQKFDREVAHLRKQEATLQSWGIWVQEVSFPDIFLVCIPRHTQVVTVPTVGALLDGKGRPTMQLLSFECPSLSARAFGVRLRLDDFEIRPPSVTFIDAWSRELLQPGIVRGFHETESGQYMDVLNGAHPKTGLPFLCLRGIREYHDHPEHTGDDWMLYRGDFAAFDIVMMLWRTCLQSVKPHVVSASPPQIGAVLPAPRI